MLVYGLKDLITVCCNKNVEFSDIKLYNGVTKIAHATFVVKNKTGVLHQGVGYKNLVLLCKEEDISDLNVGFIGLTEQQQECCEFYVFCNEGCEEELEEMIKTSLTLNTPQGGNRDVCGENCKASDHNHEEIVNEKNEAQSSPEEVVETSPEAENGVEDIQLYTSVEGEEKPDFDFAESLLTDDEKQSKISLAGYAEGFGVILKRNMKFENMLQEFKSGFE